MSELKNEEIKSAKITVTYETTLSRGSNDFKNLQELKLWLDKHPVIAVGLGYSKKK